MKEYFDEDEYLEDTYGDEIKIGDIYYRFKFNSYDSDAVMLIHEKNLKIFCIAELNLKKEER